MNFALICILAISNNPGIISIQGIDQTSISFSVDFDELPDFASEVTRLIISDNKPLYNYSLRGIREYNGLEIYNNLSPVTVGAPVTINSIKMYPITIHPAYNNNNKIFIYDGIDIIIRYSKSHKKIDLSPSMYNVFKDLVLNSTMLNMTDPLGYLIITPNSFADEVQSLADWKEKKGWHVTIATLSQTGNTPASIKSYIANAYNTWPIPPEYVLLIGDRDSVPSYSTAAPVLSTDHPYTMIQGNDFLSELLIGRLPANTSSELNTMVAKILGYEKTPYIADTIWYNRSLMVAANFPIDTMTTPIATKLWIREKLMLNGFAVVDTVFYPPVSGPAQITAAINQGVIFVNYRGGIADPGGWVYPNFHNSDVIGLNNAWKLPIITSITCLTGNFGYATCFGESWLRAGTPINPKGAVAFIGASAATTSSRWNNCLDYGIYWAILKENINNIGPAFYRAKMEVFNNFPNDTSWLNGSSFYFHTYNLLGDPGMEIFTDVPKPMTVNHPDSFKLGINNISIQVQSSGQPVAEAMVSLYKQNEIKEVGFTDQSGTIDMIFLANTIDTLFVTVTKHNHIPYCGFSLINNSNTLVAYYAHQINDPAGNNNGEINPGEEIQMPLTLKNYGNSTAATNVSARLRSSDPLIMISDSLKNYGSIAPGDTATAGAFIFTVSNNAKHGHLIKFDLFVSSDQGSWNSKLWTKVNAPDLIFLDYQIIDGGNNILEPGETAECVVWLKNIGLLDAANVNGILRSLNLGVSVIDSVGAFGNIAIQDSANNNSNRFQVYALPGVAPGHQMRCRVLLNGSNNFQDTIDFFIEIGVVQQNTPLGPDQYGYFAYDNTDTQYSEHPVYNWIEIDPALAGPGDTISLQNDQTKTLALPFIFKFYGQNYTRLSVSSNGYLAMDSTWIADMYNWRIPAAGGPPLLIAPFWDDLDPVITDSSGNICYWYDSGNHRYIVEYSRIQHIHDPTNPTPAELQTFEVMLYDPQFYPSRTGDGEIVFQYMRINNDDVWHNYSTVGIENYNHTIGIEYTFSNIYPPAAAPLLNGRAIKFTTDPPDSYPGIEEYKSSINFDAALSIHPNPFSEKLHIGYCLGRNAKHAAINIYDVTGRLVISFPVPTSCFLVPACLVWDGTDMKGNSLPSGLYIINLTINGLTYSKKTIMIR